MQINTKFNVGDTVYRVQPCGTKQVPTQTPCPYCNGVSGQTFHVFANHKDIIKCYFSSHPNTTMIDGNWYSAKCEHGNIIYARPSCRVRKETIAGIDITVGDDAAVCTEYILKSDYDEYREAELYADQSEAQSEADRRNQKYIDTVQSLIKTKEDADA